MGNATGWGLTARLLSKHCGVLGERVLEAIANVDPATATGDDRDRLAATLRDTAQLLANARAAFDQEHADVAKLRALIARDEQATDKLAVRLAAGTISEATVALFCDELEANRARLPQAQEQADARAYIDGLQAIIDTLGRQLAEFDAEAQKAMRALAASKAQKDLHQLRMARKSTLVGLPPMTGQASAQNISSEASFLRVVADIGDTPRDHAARIDAIRKSVSRFQTAGETTLERLQRLSPKAA